MSSASAASNPVASRLAARLQALQPVHLDILDESSSHNVPAGAESHFRVTLVSAAFAGARQVARHQQVYALVAEELAGPVHALALHTFTPEEWQDRGGAVTASPDCLGGKARE